jgi:hypothetical protein
VLQLRLRPNDAAPAPQHCSYVYVNITTNLISCKSVGDVINNITNSVADPDPVGSGPFWLDPDLDVWDRIQNRIRILALINDHISTFLVCLKAKDTSGISVVLLFGS